MKHATGSSDKVLQLGQADIVRLRDRGIRRTVAYAHEKSQFWRGRLLEAGVSPEDIRSAEMLMGIPLMHKADLVGAGRDLWCVPPKQVVDVVTTSGTTGRPTIYPLTESDIRRLGYNERLSFTCAGITPADVVLLAVTMDRCFMAGLAYYEGLRQIGAMAVRVGSGSPAMVLSLLRQIQPTAIVSVPSSLRVIAACAAEHGVAIASSPVTKLICIGEPVRDADFSPTPLAQELEAAWGARVYSTYGATEIAGSLCECSAGSGGHLHPELLHLEILDGQGLPVPAGQVGEIVATTLGVEAMPLIRFCTGDVSYLVDQQCACGRWTPRIGPILGRKDQMLKIKGTTVYPAAVQRALEAIPQVTGYVMIATSLARLSDHLEVVVAVRSEVHEPKQRIEGLLQGELKVTPAIRIAPVGEVAGLQESGGLRKKRVFIDRRPERVE